MTTGIGVNCVSPSVKKRNIKGQMTSISMNKTTSMNEVKKIMPKK